MADYIEKRSLKWYATLNIPKDVQGIIGSQRFVKSLETDSRTTALRRAGPLVATWKGEIEAARTGTRDPIERDIKFWRETLKDADHHAEEGEFSDRDIILDVLEGQAVSIDKKTPGEGVEFFDRATGKRTETTEYLDEWLKSLQDTPKTIDMKRSEMDRFAKVFPTLDRINKKEVKRWCVGLMGEKGLKLKTINKNLSFIRSYWAYLVSIEVVSDEYKPLHGLGLKAKASMASDTAPFSPEDVIRLKAEANKLGDEQLADLITLGMWTGCRLNELCALKIDKVKPDHFEIDEAKTTAGWRKVPIHSKLAAPLKRLIGDRKDGFVLTGLSANKYEDRSNAIGKRFGRLKADMGFRPRVETFHSIRGTVATLLDNAGVPENVAADLLGHEKPTLTYGLYSGGSDLETKAAALQKIRYPDR